MQGCSILFSITFYVTLFHFSFYNFFLSYRYLLLVEGIFFICDTVELLVYSTIVSYQLKLIELLVLFSKTRLWLKLKLVWIAWPQAQLYACWCSVASCLYAWSIPLWVIHQGYDFCMKYPNHKNCN